MADNQTNKSKSYVVPISIVVAGLLIAVSVFYSGDGKKDADSQNSANQQDNSAITEPQIGDDVVLGDLNAPVTFMVFGDYQCPFCEKFFFEAEASVREQYVKTGKVKMVYKDFPLSNIHPFAQAAAEAAECAKDQGKYWEYHDLLFNRQDQISSQNFVGWAQELGLDTNQYEECFESRKYKDEVLGDLQEGIDLGVNGTPGTFINDKFVSGAQPFSVVQNIIESELSK